jgi:hypothetical protein
MDRTRISIKLIDRTGHICGNGPIPDRPMTFVTAFCVDTTYAKDFRRS